jgi:hypothetical protein
LTPRTYEKFIFNRQLTLQYDFEDNIIVYSFQHRNASRIFQSNNQYIVVVKDSRIDFIEGNIDGEYDYLDETLYQGFPRIDWHRERLGERYIEIKIENNSAGTKLIWVYSIVEDLREILIRDQASYLYKIDARLFTLGGLRIQVQRGAQRNPFHILLRNHHSSNLNIILNSNGYEIIYY